MKIHSVQIPGCYLIEPIHIKDNRGSFVKVFRKDEYCEFGFETTFAEEYFSFSNQGVLRGLHFQKPPADHVKIVCCLSGVIFDAIVDLRVGSPTYGKYETFELSGCRIRMLYLPPGIAHGFYVISKSAIVAYMVTSLYSPEHDSGILWKSTPIPWPDRNPTLSERDRTFMPMIEFVSPFIYRK